MRNIRLQFLKFSAYTMISICSLAGCGIRKKEIARNLEIVKLRDSISEFKYRSVLLVEQYGANLQGSFNVADTSGTDSTEIVSNGITLKLKVKGAKPGTKVDYSAKATPTARSTLTQSGEGTTTVKEASRVMLSETKKITTKSLSGWVWFALIMIAIGIIALVYKKVINKLKGIL